MKIFRELYFRGTPGDLNRFAEEIGSYVKGDWSLVPREAYGIYSSYLFFDYTGKKAENARVSIYLGDNINTGELNVGNIVPLKKSQLSVEEYNAVLMLFYNDIVIPYRNENDYLDISLPTGDKFDPSTVMSELSLQKLRKFCGSANKSTGSSHAIDRDNWLSFICQTVKEDRILDRDTLCEFLQDEEYWRTEPGDFVGVTGIYAWDEESARELSDEYETMSEAMEYYKINGRK